MLERSTQVDLFWLLVGLDLDRSESVSNRDFVLATGYQWFQSGYDTAEEIGNRPRFDFPEME
jgi:hypothetical protein